MTLPAINATQEQRVHHVNILYSINQINVFLTVKTDTINILIKTPNWTGVSNATQVVWLVPTKILALVVMNSCLMTNVSQNVAIIISLKKWTQLWLAKVVRQTACNVTVLLVHNAMTAITLMDLIALNVTLVVPLVLVEITRVVFPVRRPKHWMPICVIAAMLNAVLVIVVV